MTDEDGFEERFYIGRMFVDEPGHTSWEGSDEITDELLEAYDRLVTAAESIREMLEGTGALGDRVEFRPEDHAAVASVAYDSRTRTGRSGSTDHGLDIDEAEALASVLYLGLDDLDNAGELPSEEFRQKVESLMRSLEAGRSAALRETAQ